ncbi:MAG: hypothetical protein RMA76_12050 [Deltaproteobacteria bacterium]|jgi:hypothetical protein
MASIENSFANMTANVAGGFSNQILGQASYINRLQQGGSAAASGGTSPEQFVARLNADPMLQQRAIQAMQKDPRLIGKAIRDLSARPHLARQLPPAIKRFLTQAIQSGGY